MISHDDDPGNAIINEGDGGTADLQTKLEENRMVRGEDLVTPSMLAEREIIKSIEAAGNTLRNILSHSALGAESGEALVLKVQLSAALSVLERANAIVPKNKDAAKGGSISAKVQSEAFRRVLAKRLSKGKVVDMPTTPPPMAAEADGCNVSQTTTTDNPMIDKTMGVLPPRE